LGIELNYKTFGQGEPLIILHGLFGMLDNWKSFARRLENDYLVITVDLRNHGKSPRDEEHNYRVMAEDISEFLDRNFLFEAHVLGHSMGAKVAMYLALEYSGKVKSLIAADMGVKQYPGGHEYILETLSKTPVAKAKSRKELHDFLKERLELESIVQFLMKNLKRNKEDGGFEWKFQLDVLRNCYSEILAPVQSTHTFSGPTSFLMGGASHYLSEGDLPDIRRFFPEARLEIIPGAGHWIHADAPEQTEELVRAHLERAINERPDF